MLKEKLTAGHLRGVITALITPFGRSKVNRNKFKELIGLANDAGISGIVPLGTTGESPALHGLDYPLVAQLAIDNAREGMAVIVGAGSNNTNDTIHNIDSASRQGADGVLVVTPYYNKPTPAGIKRHFLSIADKSSIPIILYHIPGRCGVGISVEVVLELAEHENIIGVKEAGGDVWRSGEIARQAPDNFAVLSGDDALTLTLLSVGAVGVISVISNLAPRLMKQMIDHALAGDFQHALSIHRRLSPLLSALSLETNPGPIKEAMNLLEMKVGQVRSPLAPVTKITRNAIRQALKDVGELE